MKCKICGNDTTKIFDKRVLYKYNVSYYQCTACDFIQTETPYWLEEAYVSSMNLSDTGVMMRSERMSKITTSIICLFLKTKGTFLDYAGGLGVFTRSMRDIGFNYFWDDPYTKNEVARGFDGSLDTRYDMVTTFESFEHFNDPMAELEKLLVLTDTLVLTTDLVPDNVDKNWWYVAPEHGQHIAFHSKKSFRVMAKKHNLHYYNAKNVHVLTKKKFGVMGALLFNNPFSKVLLYLGYFFFTPFLKSKAVDDMNSFYIKDANV